MAGQAIVVAAETPTAETAPTGGRLITGEEFALIPNKDRCELVEGRIVKMSPTGDDHGGYESNFALAIGNFVRAHNLGKMRVGESGVYTRRDPDSVRGMDVAFISNERWAQRKKTGAFLDVPPDLVVEILSPDDAWSDMTDKLREYFTIGVRLVWVADPKKRRVYTYRSLSDVREFNEPDDLPGDDVLPGFSAPVAELFAE